MMVIRIQMLQPLMTSQVGTGQAAVATTRQAELAEGSPLSGTRSVRVRQWQGSNVLKRFCVGVQRREEAVEPSGVWLYGGRQKRGAKTKGANAAFFLGVGLPRSAAFRVSSSCISSLLSASCSGLSHPLARPQQSLSESDGRGRGGETTTCVCD